MAYRIASIHRIGIKSLTKYQLRNVSNYFQPSESEYVDRPTYPAILDMSRQAVKDRRIESVATRITNLPTVEEKLIELNEPKYYGWWACHLNEDNVTYNSLPFCQFATRTVLAPAGILPPIYSQLEDKVNDILPLLTDRLVQLILQETHSTR